ncbi:MAG: tRNA (adenosine(37)-N6)-threonylcarbamoyltransferase complex ATPase subunit type 1 TsaE [Elusimicrobiota bacterium]|nr:MAG: tRNA (adenosine(37)-N6)-threonylcarbamoyltransferase complex ATPase subunit type 1 TsaE [Elusimicrobiota bacterium]
MKLASEKETIALGVRIGKALKPGAVVLLHGELGAGKTTFARGLARGAGCRGRVSSPTFALAHLYRGKRLDVHHLDLYRLKAGEDGELGLDELLADPRGAVVVEWPDAARSSWPKDRLELTLAHAPPGRTAALKATGPASRKILESLP